MEDNTVGDWGSEERRNLDEEPLQLKPFFFFWRGTLAVDRLILALTWYAWQPRVGGGWERDRDHASNLITKTNTSLRYSDMLYSHYGLWFD